MNGGSKLTIDTNLSSCLKKPNQCLGIIFQNEGGSQTASLKCSDCDVKKRFMCSRSPAEFTSKISKAKIPCIPSIARSKRNDDEFGDDKDDVEYGKIT